jgi:hypothetical protein
MREFRSYGSVRGALRNERPYRDHQKKPRPVMTGAYTARAADR